MSTGQQPTNLQLMGDENQIIAFYRAHGENPSQRAIDKTMEVLRANVGEYNGSLTQGGVWGSIQGIIQHFFKFLQQLADGKSIEAANQEAGKFAANAGIQSGLARACFILKECARNDPEFAALGRIAEPLTGQYQTGSDGIARIPKHEDPTNLSARLRAGRGLSDYVPEWNGSLNRREIYHQPAEILRVDTPVTPVNKPAPLELA